MKNIGGLNMFSAAANLTLSTFSGEEKNWKWEENLMLLEELCTSYYLDKQHNFYCNGFWKIKHAIDFYNIQT